MYAYINSQSNRTLKVFLIEQLSLSIGQTLKYIYYKASPIKLKRHGNDENIFEILLINKISNIIKPLIEFSTK